MFLDLPEGGHVDGPLPVTFGVPFPEGALWDTDSLHVIDEQGNPVPAQFETTDLWAEDGAVKWVRVDALPTTPGNLFVEVLDGVRPTLPAVPLTVVEDGAEWVVDTGVAEYVIGAGGALIKEARLGGHLAAGCPRF